VADTNDPEKPASFDEELSSEMLAMQVKAIAPEKTKEVALLLAVRFLLQLVEMGDVPTKEENEQIVLTMAWVFNSLPKAVQNLLLKN
jgi:hypothetical protein